METIRLRSGALDWREIEDEIVAVDLEQANYLATNRSAALLWPALVEGTTMDALVACLVESYEIPVSTARKDVDAFVRALAEQHLLEGPL